LINEEALLFAKYLMPNCMLCSIYIILYTSWIQTGVWLGESSSAFAQFNLFEEKKNAKK